MNESHTDGVTESLTLTVTGHDYRTGEVCEWTSPVSNWSSHSIHVVRDEEGATLELNGSGFGRRAAETGGYVHLDAAAITSLIAALTICRDGTLPVASVPLKAGDQVKILADEHVGQVATVNGVQHDGQVVVYFGDQDEDEWVYDPQDLEHV
jgi:hypothetical protein